MCRSRQVRRTGGRVLVCLVTALCSAAALADYELDWFTSDGGGEMWTSSDDFELSGTIGQADAGVAMTGGPFRLTGGFWFATASTPLLLGDLNCDGLVNFGDVQPFVLALSDPQGYAKLYPDCPLANRDVNGDGKFDFGDINPFVNLLSGAS